jgi:hypothetical protein
MLPLWMMLSGLQQRNPKPNANAHTNISNHEELERKRSVGAIGN